jgi:hypothetical protein
LIIQIESLGLAGFTKQKQEAHSTLMVDALPV